jgi:hypothetical protein
MNSFVEKNVQIDCNRFLMEAKQLNTFDGGELPRGGGEDQKCRGNILEVEARIRNAEAISWRWRRGSEMPRDLNSFADCSKTQLYLIFIVAEYFK